LVYRGETPVKSKPMAVKHAEIDRNDLKTPGWVDRLPAKMDIGLSRVTSLVYKYRLEDEDHEL